MAKGSKNVDGGGEESCREDVKVRGPAGGARVWYQERCFGLASVCDCETKERRRTLGVPMLVIAV